MNIIDQKEITRTFEHENCGDKRNPGQEHATKYQIQLVEGLQDRQGNRKWGVRTTKFAHNAIAGIHQLMDECRSTRWFADPVEAQEHYAKLETARFIRRQRIIAY